MTGLISEPIGDVAEQRQGSESYPASVWDSQDWMGLTRQFFRASGNAQAELGTVDDYGRQTSAPEPSVDPGALNQKWGIPGHLKFDGPLPESVAQSMYEAKRDELAREDAAQRSDASGLTRAGAALVSGAADPSNIAAAFIPFVGEARAAGWMAKAAIDLGEGFFARSAARAVAGAASGAAAQIPLVGLRYGLSKQEQADYSATDAMADIIMGGVLGGGLHTAIGGAGDLIGQAFGRSRVAGLAEDSPAARETLMRASVGAVASDEPVDLAPVLSSTDLRSAYADRLAARGDTAPGNYASYTPQGQRIELRPEVAELDSLTASHNPDGSVNDAFPHDEGIPPRYRISAASQAQIAEMASRLEPERLGPSPEASTGAPIVNQNGVVESGNGRVLALNRVYNEPALATQAQAYRALLEAGGHDVTGMRPPVLIGRRMTDLSPEDTLNFVRGANERATLGMNAAEQARMDADRAGRAVSAYRPAALASRDNEPFVGQFMAQLPAEERAGMLLTDGKLSSTGEARIRAALLAHAYGDALGPTLERILNGDVDHMKGVAGALTDVAGAWSQLRAAAARGDIPAGLDITPEIGEAVQLLDRARSSGTPIARLLEQSDMINRPTPAAEALLRVMFRDDAMRLPTARAKLAATLDRYVEQSMEAKPGPGLLGEHETSAAAIMGTIGDGDPRMEGLASALDGRPDDARPPQATPDAERAALEQQATDLRRQIEAMRSETEPNPEIDEALREAARGDERSSSFLKGIEQASACILGGVA